MGNRENGTNWNQFHDSTIQEILISLEKEEVILKVSVAEQFSEGIKDVSIVAESVTSINCPLQKPWGKSCSVNEITEKGNLLNIEMQSGDTIVIEAKEFIVKPVID